MPNRHGFNVLPFWGNILHACIEEGCDFPDPIRAVSEQEQQAHAKMHAKEREKIAKKKQAQALAAARAALKAKKKENRG